MATYPIKRRNTSGPSARIARRLAQSLPSGLRKFSDICNSLMEGHMPLSHSTSAIMIGAWLAIGVPVSASANVITDWDEKAVAVVTPAGAFGGHSRSTWLSE